MQRLVLAALAAGRADAGRDGGSGDDPWTFADLLGDLSEAQFFDEYWQRQPVHIRGACPDPAQRLRLRMSALGAVMGSPAYAARVQKLNGQPPNLEGPRAKLHELVVDPANACSGFCPLTPLDVFRDGSANRVLRHYPGSSERNDGAEFHDVFDAWLAGATLVLASVEKFWAPVEALCLALIDGFGLPFTANAYATPAGAQGFFAHSDHQDLFVLQLSGRKEWKLYHTPIQHPYAGQKVGRRPQGEPDALGPGPASPHGHRGAPLQTVALEPGDVMYLPRGVVHEAATTDASPSLHLALTADTETFSAASFVDCAPALGQPLLRRCDTVFVSAAGMMFAAAADRSALSADLQAVVNRDLYLLNKRVSIADQQQVFSGAKAMAYDATEADIRAALPPKLVWSANSTLEEQGKRQVAAAVRRYIDWLRRMKEPGAQRLHCPDCVTMAELLQSQEHFDRLFSVALSYLREALDARRAAGHLVHDDKAWYGIHPDNRLELTERANEARVTRGGKFLEIRSARGKRTRSALGRSEAALVKALLADKAGKAQMTVGGLPSIDGYAAIAVAAKLERLGLLKVVQ